MTAFTLTLAPAARPALAIVATHGLTDFGSAALTPSYLLCLACPAPSVLVTALFCAASVLHLSLEAGWLGSLALHALAAVLDWTHGHDVAFGAFLAYLACVHTPQHYARERRRGNGALVTLATLAGLGLACVWAPVTFVLTDALQRVVVAHVLVVHACF
ncbi:MAG: hypothetical protein CMB11_01790 [Euryarchaeota archaeon]|nr:hypothetical protein [Euryarchaeota archaeon]